MAIDDRDKGWSELGRTLESLRGNPHVLVGVQGPQAASSHEQDDALTVADVASFNEFGQGVPERSFIRATIDQHEAHLRERLRQFGRGVVLGKLKPGVALELLGEETRGIIQQRIAARIDPPNAPATIARKGSSVPLIERGQLRNSISYKLVLP